MTYAGEFINVKGAVVLVEIRAGAGSDTVEIGDDSGMAFAGDEPVTIDGEASEVFDVLLRQTATVRLLVRDFQGQFFATDCRDVPVTISVDGRCVFSGYVEPQSYSQPFNDVEELLELHCIDVLTALEYRLYGDVGCSGVNYAALRSGAQNVSMLSLLKSCLGDGAVIWYDGSVRSSRNGSPYGVFSELGVSELLFLGDEEDDVWSCQEVLEEILRYLNLHIRQEGDELYIFSWSSVTAGNGNIAWRRLNPSGGQSSRSMSCEIIDISLSIAEDCSTQVSVGEVYNRLELTAEVKATSDLVESPLDGDALVSPYTGYQKYMTEIYCGGKGDDAINAFLAMLNGQATTYDAAKETDWYVQVMNHPRWKFNGLNYAHVSDLVAVYCANGTNQQDLLNFIGSRLWSKNLGATLLRVGKIEKKNSGTDNSLVSKVNMDTLMAIAVNGETNENRLLAAMPVAEYTGNVSGGVLSPADGDTTNYIVLSGKILLNPLTEQSLDETNPVYSRSSGDNTCYRRFLYWKAETPRQPVERDTESGKYATSSVQENWHPDVGDGKQWFRYDYSAEGNSTDMCSKVSVLACMLVIGDKCVVETGTHGQVGDFEWRTYKERGTCSDEDYFNQCFFIGFDPKITDFLVGQEYPFQNNIDYTMGLDAEGIAIPIKKDDRVSGQVHFKVLGPVNVEWKQWTRKHPSFWRRTSYIVDSEYIMEKVKNIIIKSFEVKVCTDNGHLGDGDGDDLVYMSDTAEDFVNKKDDLSFKLTSALTAADASRLGVSTAAALSTPVVMSSGLGVTEVYDAVRNLEAKAEKLYVDDYYTRCHVPKVVLEETLTDGASAGQWLRYRHPALPSRVFHVVSMSRDIGAGTARMVMREV